MSIIQTGAPTPDPRRVRQLARRAAAAGTGPSAGTPPRRRTWWRALLATPSGLYGVVAAAVLLVAAGVSLVYTPYDPGAANPYDQWFGPSFAHLMGTDNVGRDIFSVLLAGTRTTVQVAVGSALIAAVVGVALAALGSLTARWVREGIAVLIDILIAFPTILVALMLASVFGGSLGVVIVAVGVSFGVNIARVSRGEIRRIARSEYVLAATASGLGRWRVLTRHLLPNIAPVFIVQLSWSMALAVLAEAGLSYLGYGAPASTPSWGRLLAELQPYIGVHPLAVLWPGLVITLTVLGFNLLGDGLRDATDPRVRQGGNR